MIEYKNVVLRYTDTDILKDVNLCIEQGEFMVLVGPSGSGKTTMLKMINRLLEPTDGNIYLDEKRIESCVFLLVMFCRPSPYFQI